MLFVPILMMCGLKVCISGVCLEAEKHFRRNSRKDSDLSGRGPMREGEGQRRGSFVMERAR